MKTIVFLSLIVCIAVAMKIKPPVQVGDTLVVTKNLVETVNNKKTTWTASTEQGYISSLTRSQIKSLLGAKKGGPKLSVVTYGKAIQLPDNFDSRTNWPKCATMNVIRDQSACGSCWAFGAVEAMSDRYCVFGVNSNLSISAEDLNDCCDSCGDGCDGGYPSAAWEYWTESGLVSSDCKPYSLPSCDHHLPNSTNPCPSQEYPTPACTSQCTDGENYSKAKHFGKTAYSVSGASDFQNELYQNGPFEVAFEVYEDFLAYKTGVYQHVTGSFLGGHAVKVLGWGVDTSSTPYWIVANSWNTHWGDKGYFKILRGNDECGIEDEGDCGAPLS